MEKYKTFGSERSWWDIGDKILTSVLKIMEIRTNEAMQARRKKIMKYAATYALFLVGAIYLLNGLSILFNLFFGSIWVGYILVGFGLFAIGALIKKK